MIPVTQTITGDGKGNCFAACVASVLELDLVDVPNFCVEHGDSFWPDYNRWLRRFGLYALNFPVTREQGIALLAGQRPEFIAADTIKESSDGLSWLVVDEHEVAAPAEFDSRDAATRCAIRRFTADLTAEPIAVEHVRRELRGKNLACWCKPGAPCHADVLLRVANQD